MKSVFLIIFQFLCCPASAQKSIFYTRRIEVKPLSILEYDLNVKCSGDSVKASAYLRFYDSLDHELLECKAGPVASVTCKKMGDYTEAPPYTKYALVTVERDSAKAGEIVVDGFSATLNVGVPAVKHDPLYDPEQYMRPFWNSDTIYK